MPMTAALLEGSRLHLNHGPIDLIIWAEGKSKNDVSKAYQLATHRFESVLEELVSELSCLKAPINNTGKPPRGNIAKRMYEAAMYYSGALFVTSMASVAGAVADEMLQCILKQSNLNRAYVNNGGDISIFLGKGQKFTLDISSLKHTKLGQIELSGESGLHGVATSGRGGRSLTLGIADSVTVLAKNASDADVAATLIANHVDIPGHPAIARKQAEEIVDDSDLEGKEIVVSCGHLTPDEVRLALARGNHFAEKLCQEKKIISAILFLQNSYRIVGKPLKILSSQPLYGELL